MSYKMLKTSSLNKGHAHQISLQSIQKTVEVHSSKNFLTQINQVWRWYIGVSRCLVGQLVCVSLSLARSKVLEWYVRDCKETLYIRSTSSVDVQGIFLTNEFTVKRIMYLELECVYWGYLITFNDRFTFYSQVPHTFW